MNLLPLSVFVLLLSVPPVSAADHPPIKDGMPCVEEVCVGDDASSLTHLPWQAAVIPATDTALATAHVSERYLGQLRRTLRGEESALRAVAPYWFARRLDADGLRALAGVRAVCASPGFSGRLKGTYVSRDGLRTVVSFEPMASEDGKTHRFVVASIHRYVDDRLTPAQLGVLGRQTQARYAGLPSYGSTTEAAAAWMGSSRRGPHLLLLAPVGDSVERDANLRKHPECASAFAPTPP